ncbi:MAG: gluconokinase [Chloroflexota bacterium]
MVTGTTTISTTDAEPPLILAIDLGSSSARAVLYDRLARVVDGTLIQEKFQLRTTGDGASEDDPDIALERTAHCVDAALSAAGPLATQIGAVAIDTLVSNILAIDSAGMPLTPIITYADTRNALDADALRDSLDERTVHDRTGCMLRTSYWPARLNWFRRVKPDIWRNTARWLTLGEYIELRLFGRCRVSYSVASWSGLLDRHTLTWDEPLLNFLGVEPDHLSPLVDIDAPLQGLREPYAARWPALRDIPWYPAVGDGAAANVGSGCTNHDRIALTIGTSGAMRVVQDDVPQVPPGLWCYRVDRQRALLGGATSEGGNVYGWLRRTLQLSSPTAIEAALASSTPDSHGLTVLPFLAGERSPDWAGDVQATIHGVTLATTPHEILQASLEAVAYRFALIEKRICARPGCGHKLIASGGALLGSPAWMQMFADVIGRTVVASAEPEATSRGTALLALRSLGAIPSIEAVPAADGEEYEPDSSRHTIYQAAIERQGRLYNRLISQR